MRRVSKRDQVAKALRLLLDQYPEKYIISLAHRHDRRARVRQEFAALGVDIDEAGIAWFEGLQFDDPAGFPNAGVRGCFHSHLTLLRRCADNGRPMLIMEDDVHFNRSATTAWQSALNPFVPWDIFYLGYVSPVGLVDEAPLLIYPGKTIGGHFYAIKPSLAGRMAAFMEECLNRQFGDPAGGPMYRDGAFNHYRAMHDDVRTLLTIPTLAKQFSSRSDLAKPPAIYDRFPASQAVLNIAGRIKSIMTR